MVALAFVSVDEKEVYIDDICSEKMEKSKLALNKKRKTVGESSGSGLGEKPTWERNDLLSKVIDAKCSPQFYLDKVGHKSIWEKFILYEKRVLISDFQYHGVIDCFKRLGWMGALTFVGVDEKKVYIDDICFEATIYGL
ncbi:hypothetical protein R6Q59_006566 [Mikania micrantha]